MDVRNSKYKVLIFFLLITSLLSVSALASNLDIRVVPIKDDISIYEEAVFEIVVTNFNNFDETISIYSPNIDVWSVKVIPSTYFLSPGERVNIPVRIMPKSSIIQGAEYGVQFNIRAVNSEKLERVHAFIGIKSQDQIAREYLPILALNLPELNEVDVTEQVLFNFEIENKNIRKIEDLSVVISSDVFNDFFKLNIGPLEKKEVQTVLNAPFTTRPQEGVLTVALNLGNQTLIKRTIDYEIIEVENQGVEQSSVKEILFTSTDVKLSNDGNVPITATYRVPTVLLDYFFIRGNMNSRLINDGGYFKEFYIELLPGERYDLFIVVSYRFLLYIIAGLLLLSLIYYTFRSPLTIHKSVVSISVKEDSLSEMKVLLHIKNRTRKVFDNIIVLDKIPKITEMGKEFSLGTLRPTKIMNHEKKGTIAKWELKALDSYEERVLTYKLYSNLTIVGGLTLPISILKFKSKIGREKKVVSNKVKLLIQKFKGEKKE